MRLTRFFSQAHLSLVLLLAFLFASIAHASIESSVVIALKDSTYAQTVCYISKGGLDTVSCDLYSGFDPASIVDTVTLDTASVDSTYAHIAGVQLEHGNVAVAFAKSQNSNGDNSNYYISWCLMDIDGTLDRCDSEEATYSSMPTRILIDAMRDGKAGFVVASVLNTVIDGCYVDLAGKVLGAMFSFTPTPTVGNAAGVESVSLISLRGQSKAWISYEKTGRIYVTEFSDSATAVWSNSASSDSSYYVSASAFPNNGAIVCYMVGASDTILKCVRFDAAGAVHHASFTLNILDKYAASTDRFVVETLNDEDWVLFLVTSDSQVYTLYYDDDDTLFKSNLFADAAGDAARVSKTYSLSATPDNEVVVHFRSSNDPTLRVYRDTPSIALLDSEDYKGTVIALTNVLYSHAVCYTELVSNSAHVRCDLYSTLTGKLDKSIVIDEMAGYEFKKVVGVELESGDIAVAFGFSWAQGIGYAACIVTMGASPSVPYCESDGLPSLPSQLWIDSTKDGSSGFSVAYQVTPGVLSCDFLSTGHRDGTCYMSEVGVAVSDSRSLIIPEGQKTAWLAYMYASSTSIVIAGSGDPVWDNSDWEENSRRNSMVALRGGDVLLCYETLSGGIIPVCTRLRGDFSTVHEHFTPELAGNGLLDSGFSQRFVLTALNNGHWAMFYSSSNGKKYISLFDDKDVAYSHKEVFNTRFYSPDSIVLSSTRDNGILAGYEIRAAESNVFPIRWAWSVLKPVYDNYVTITAPADGATVTDNVQVIEGTVTKGLSKITVRSGSRVWRSVATSEGDFKVLVRMDAGANTFKVYASDSIREYSAIESVTLTLSAAATSAPTITVPVEDELLSTLTPSITGTSPTRYTKVYVYDGNTRVGEADVDGNGDWTVAQTPMLRGGFHTFTAIARDAAGLPSSASGPVKVLVMEVDGVACYETSASTTTGTTSDVVVRWETDADPDANVDGKFRSQLAYYFEKSASAVKVTYVTCEV